MNYAALLQSALVALLRNKMRSISTVLGITIGIAAVICVVAIGKAGQARVEQQLPSANQIEARVAAKATSTVIQVKDVHKYYELGETRVHALRGVSVEIQCGEFLDIMGASGSGKSTFMNILGCLDRPSSGQYLLEGIDVSKHDKKTLALIRNQKLGFVFQGFNLLARTTALENTELPTLYTKIDKAERHKRATEVRRWSVWLTAHSTFLRRCPGDSNSG